MTLRYASCTQERFDSLLLRKYAVKVLLMVFSARCCQILLKKFFLSVERRSSSPFPVRRSMIDAAATIDISGSGSTQTCNDMLIGNVFCSSKYVVNLCTAANHRKSNEKEKIREKKNSTRNSLAGNSLTGDGNVERKISNRIRWFVDGEVDLLCTQYV